MRVCVCGVCVGGLGFVYLSGTWAPGLGAVAAIICRQTAASQLVSKYPAHARRGSVLASPLA